MDHKTYHFKAEILKNPDMDAGYIIVPMDIRKTFNKGRVKVNALYDAVVYQGSIVNTGLKHTDGSICYVIGVPKSVRSQLNKTYGDTIDVSFSLRD